MPMPKKYNVAEKTTEIRALREQYAETVSEMESLNNRSTDEKRSLTPEELIKFSELEARANEFNAQANRLETIHTQYTNVHLHQRNSEQSTVDPLDNQNRDGKEIKELEVRANDVYKNWVLTGNESSKNEYRNITDEILETREITTANTQNKTVPEMGGNLLPHEIFMTELFKGIDKNNIIRTHARILQYKGAHKITMPVLTDRGTGARWLGEIDKTPESKMTFGQKDMEAFRLSNCIPVSRALIEHSAISIPNLIATEMTIDLAEKMEEAYLYGDGDKKPLGIFTVDTSGITVSRDVSIGTTTELVTYEGFLDVLKILKSRYKTNAVLVLSTQAKIEFMKIKDDAGNYLWHNNITSNEPSTFLGIPVLESDHINASSTIASGDYIGFLADLEMGYYIPENRNLETFVYNELFRQYDSVGFQVDINTGGLPVRPEAFVRLKAGGSTVGKSRTSVPNDTQVASLKQQVTSLEKELADEKLNKNQQGNTDTKSATK